MTRSDPSARVGRRRRAGAAGRPCGAHRAEPAGTVGGGRRRRRHRLGRRLWLGGSREPGASRARDAVQDRHRLHGAHLGRRRPAAGEGPAEARRRDSDLRACVPRETVAGDAAPVDGASRRRQERRRRRGAVVLDALRAAGRSAAGLCGASAAVRAGDPVPLLELRLDPGERGRRSRRGRAVPDVHAEADLRAAGHGRHEGRLRRRRRSRTGRRPISRGSRRIPATART